MNTCTISTLHAVQGPVTLPLFTVPGYEPATIPEGRWGCVGRYTDGSGEYIGFPETFGSREECEAEIERIWPEVE
jgi:hypothetical protein